MGNFNSEMSDKEEPPDRYLGRVLRDQGKVEEERQKRKINISGRKKLDSLDKAHDAIHDVQDLTRKISQESQTVFQQCSKVTYYVAAVAIVLRFFVALEIPNVLSYHVESHLEFQRLKEFYGNHEQEITSSEAFAYCTVGSVERVSDTISKGLQVFDYVHRLTEKKVVDGLNKLWSLPDQIGKLFYGPKSAGKTTTIGVVSLKYTIPYHVDKHAANLWPMFDWVSKIGLISEKVEVVSSLDKYQLKFNEVYPPNTTDLPSLDFGFRLLYFDISLNDIAGPVKDVFVAEMNSYLDQIPFEFDRAAFEGALKREKEKTLIWIHLKDIAGYDHPYKQMIKYCRHLSVFNVRCMIESSKPWVRRESEEGAGRFSSSVIGPIPPMQVNYFAKSLNPDARELGDNEIRISGGKPRVIWDILQVSFSDYKKDIHGGEIRSFLKAASQDELTRLKKICQYEKYEDDDGYGYLFPMQMYVIHNETKDDNLMSKLIKTRLIDVEWMEIVVFTKNNDGYLLCEDD